MHWFISYLAAMTRGWVNRVMPDDRNSVGFPVWMAGTQAPRATSAALPGALEGHWIRKPKHQQIPMYGMPPLQVMA